VNFWSYVCEEMEIYIFSDCILTELGILYIDVILCGCLIKANRDYHVIIAGALRIVFLIYWRIFLSSYRTNLYKIICNFLYCRESVETEELQPCVWTFVSGEPRKGSWLNGSFSRSVSALHKGISCRE
jgi:hypothetical protein